MIAFGSGASNSQLIAAPVAVTAISGGVNILAHSLHRAREWSYIALSTGLSVVGGVAGGLLGYGISALGGITHDSYDPESQKNIILGTAALGFAVGNFVGNTVTATRQANRM